MGGVHCTGGGTSGGDTGGGTALPPVNITLELLLLVLLPSTEEFR